MRFSSLTERVAGEGAAAWDIHFAALAKKRAGGDVILLSIGDPDFASPPRITETAIAALRAGDTHYADILGLPDLRRAIAAHHQAQSGQQTTMENIAVTSGAQGALFAASLCLLDRGDEAIALEPMYVTYEATIRASGADLRAVPLAAENGFRLDLDQLARAIGPKTRAIFYATPNNPTGVALNAAEIAGIADLARRHDLWIVADEVYAELTFDAPHLGIASLPGMETRVVTINSFSKSHAMTGWRLGWMVAPAPLIHHVSRLGLAMLYGSPPFIQKAGIVALEQDIPEVAAMREAYRRRRDILARHLNQVPGLFCRVPEAGMFMMLDIRRTGLSARDYAWRLFEATGVSVLDATAFGAAGAGHVRISFAAEDTALEEAARRIRAFTIGLMDGQRGEER